MSGPFSVAALRQEGYTPCAAHAATPVRLSEANNIKLFASDQALKKKIENFCKPAPPRPEFSPVSRGTFYIAALAHL
jgi:hypothetical protein